MSSPTPVSVLLPPELRERVERQARKRALKFSTAVRVLVEERLRDLDDAEELGRAEEWQRAQAWATWEAVQSGQEREVSWDELEEAMGLRERERGAASSRRRSPKTSGRRRHG